MTVEWHLVALFFCTLSCVEVSKLSRQNFSHDSLEKVFAAFS